MTSERARVCVCVSCVGVCVCVFVCAPHGRRYDHRRVYGRSPPSPCARVRARAIVISAASAAAGVCECARHHRRCARVFVYTNNKNRTAILLFCKRRRQRARKDKPAAARPSRPPTQPSLQIRHPIKRPVLPKQFITLFRLRAICHRRPPCSTSAGLLQPVSFTFAHSNSRVIRRRAYFNTFYCSAAAGDIVVQDNNKSLVVIALYIYKFN